MSYKPPHARMRQIKQKAPPPLPRGPQNVEEALAEAPAPEPEIKVPVGAVEVTVTPGEDKTFGTADDEVTISRTSADAEVEPEGDDVEDKVEDDEPVPNYDMTWKKDALVELAESLGLIIAASMTKAEIIDALDAYYAP